MKDLSLNILMLAVIAIAGCSKSPAPEPLPVTTPADLQAHGAEFRREVIKVADGVWSAVGWGAANAILIEGTDGLIIVDTTITLEHARDVLAEFRKITDKPVKAIVYTHSHPDHTGGAAVFAEGAPDGLRIYAHEKLTTTMDHTLTEFQPILSQRAVRMYGSKLTPEEMVNIGIGPEIGVDETKHVDILRPTHTFATHLDDTVAGVHFQLVHAVGETDDQIFVWLPERRILMPGDNIYRAFPNLYTIRGTTYRDLKGWAASLDKMRALSPAFLVPSHTRPVTGEQEIRDLLMNYRDAIRYVYEQSVRMINQGRTPDEIAATIKLPAHLARDPFLQEFYGTPRWSARSVFAGNLGWFDGNVTTLDPLPPLEEARRFIDLAGGSDAITGKIVQASQRGDHQWVLELSDRVLRAEPGNGKVKGARIAALIAIGSAASNPNARHFYLTAAHELRDGLKIPTRFASFNPEMLRQMPTGAFLEALSVNLHAEEVLDLDRRTVFRFTDTNETWTVWIRRGVTELQPRVIEPVDLEVRVEAQAFKEMLAQTRNPVVSLARDFEVTTGSKLDLARFFKLFEPDRPE
jgi:alkyl sulfatase BDS1-like metallo-beta-lactamase superfamily hydrolase